MKDALTKDTVIRTNLATVIAIVGVVVGAFVSYTVAINRISNAEMELNAQDKRITSLEVQNMDTQKLLVEIRTDVKAIKERGL